MLLPLFGTEGKWDSGKSRLSLNNTSSLFAALWFAQRPSCDQSIKCLQVINTSHFKIEMAFLPFLSILRSSLCHCMHFSVSNAYQPFFFSKWWVFFYLFRSSMLCALKSLPWLPWRKSPLLIALIMSQVYNYYHTDHLLV